MFCWALVSLFFFFEDKKPCASFFHLDPLQTFPPPPLSLSLSRVALTAAEERTEGSCALLSEIMAVQNTYGNTQMRDACPPSSARIAALTCTVRYWKKMIPCCPSLYPNKNENALPNFSQDHITKLTFLLPPRSSFFVLYCCTACLSSSAKPKGEHGVRPALRIAGSVVPATAPFRDRRADWSPALGRVHASSDGHPRRELLQGEGGTWEAGYCHARVSSTCLFCGRCSSFYHHSVRRDAQSLFTVFPSERGPGSRATELKKCQTVDKNSSRHGLS